MLFMTFLFNVVAKKKFKITAILTQSLQLVELCAVAL